MEQDSKISAAQLFIIAFVSRIIIMITINSRLTGGNNLLDPIVSDFIYMILNFIMIMPIYFLHKRYPDLDILEISYHVFGKGGGNFISVVFILYFFVINGYCLSMFEIFMENEINPQLPVWLISVAILVVACYGAYLGVETIARVCGFVMVAICIGLIFVVCSLLPEIHPQYYIPIMYEGPKQMLESLLLFISRSTSYLVIALLMPRAKGKLKMGFAVLNIGLFLFFAGTMAVVAGALGDYSKTQVFPIYAASAFASAGPFQRMDAIYIGVWMMGLLIKLSIDLCLLSYCAKKTWNKKAGNVLIPASAFLLVLLSSVVLKFAQLQKIFMGVRLLLPCTLIVGVLLPILLLIFDKRKVRSNEK